MLPLLSPHSTHIQPLVQMATRGKLSLTSLGLSIPALCACPSCDLYFFTALGGWFSLVTTFPSGLSGPPRRKGVCQLFSLLNSGSCVHWLSRYGWTGPLHLILSELQAADLWVCLAYTSSSLRTDPYLVNLGSLDPVSGFTHDDRLQRMPCGG